MRLAGLGVLALALVGTLVLLGQNGAFDGVWERATGDEAQRVTNPEEIALANLDIEGTNVFGAPYVHKAPVILSGFPSYAGLKFDLPVDARPVSGTLNLDFSSLVAEDVEGVLRVNVNGGKRADFILLQGSKDNALQIELTGAELTSGTLSVGLSLQGRGPIASCSLDDAIAAVVTLNGGTGILLEIDKAVETTGDRLALWGNRVPVSWPSDAADNASEQADILHQVALLESKGYTPLVASTGVGLDKLRTIAAEASVISSNNIPEAYPIALTSNPANEGVKSFTRRAIWKYSYNASELPGENLPAALDLRLKVGPRSDDVKRDIVVLVNNRLLLSRRIGSGVEQFNQSIAIPAQTQRQSNNLEIAVTAYNPEGTQCGDIPQSLGELLPETVLIGGTSNVAGPIEELSNLLTTAGSVAIDGDGITGAQARIAGALLAALEPASWEVSSDASRAMITLLRNGDLVTQSQLSDQGSHWLVYSDDQSNAQIKAKQLTKAINSGQTTASGIALLVTIKDTAPTANTLQ